MANLKVPDSFYFYTALDSVDRKQWLEEILIHNKVYFRSREQLNDPNELRPSMVFEGEDKELRKYIRELICSHSTVKLSPAKRMMEETKFIRNHRSSPELMGNIIHEILDKVGIFCLSDTPTEPLLWAHYAQGHRGVAVQFDSCAGLFAAAQCITYTNEAPIINRIKDSNTELLHKAAFTKTEEWGYEKEWRIIARWKDEVRIEQYISQHTVPRELQAFIRSQDGPGHYSIPPESIQAVIIGARISLDEKNWLEKIVKKSSTPIVLKKASINIDRKIIIE